MVQKSCCENGRALDETGEMLSDGNHVMSKVQGDSINLGICLLSGITTRDPLRLVAQSTKCNDLWSVYTSVHLVQNAAI